MSDLVLMTTNLKNSKASLNASMKYPTHVRFFSEASRMEADLRSAASRTDARLHQAQPVRKMHTEKHVMRLVSTDTALMVKKQFEYLGEIQQQVSQQVKGYAGTAPDRWFVGGAFMYEKERVAAFSIHPNAGLKALENPNHPVTREYAESMQWLDALLDMYKRMGYRLIAGGDLNFLNKPVDPKWSPYTVFKDHGMVSYGHGLDQIFWEAKEFRKVKGVIIPKTTLRTDHPGVRLQLRAR